VIEEGRIIRIYVYLLCVVLDNKNERTNSERANKREEGKASSVQPPSPSPPNLSTFYRGGGRGDSLHAP
jgi:hypothetical protein